MKQSSSQKLHLPSSCSTVLYHCNMVRFNTASTWQAKALKADNHTESYLLLPVIPRLEWSRGTSLQSRYGASLGGPLCNTSKMYVQWVRLTSHEPETAQKAQTTWQTTSPWCWSRLPLQRHGFDEPMPPEGWAALRMFVPRPLLQWFHRFNKLK